MSVRAKTGERSATGQRQPRGRAAIERGDVMVFGWTRTTSRIRAMGALVVTALVLALSGGPVPAGADPIFVNWAALLPGLTDDYHPDSTNDCTAGRPNCVRATIAEMQRRFAPLAGGCDHNAVFALAYLRTTQTYQWARDQPGYFQDTSWVNHEDAVFAKYYFRAYDGYTGGRPGDVPPAWRIAFDAAASHRVTAAGDLLLGMNAHVNRDLAVTLGNMGVTTADGQSHKPDHDKVNQFLNAVVQPLLAEITARLDPTANDIVTPFGVGYTGLFQLLEAWRESAWRNAELLSSAAPADKPLITQDIETAAAAQATALVAAYSYLPPVTSTTSRDAYCGTHYADAPPQPYAFGPATPF